MRKMTSPTGAWVSGPDFFNREAELKFLVSLIRDGNHVLLTGQRRMGKTSIARELGRRLEGRGWCFLFVDIEDADCEEHVIADIAQATHPVQSRATRAASTYRRWIGHIPEISADGFRMTIRAVLNPGN